LHYRDYYIGLYNALKFGNDTELEVPAVTRWAALVRVLMVSLNRWVFRRHLKVSKVG